MVQPAQPAQEAGQPAIRVERLSWTYRGSARPALDDISLIIPAGGCFGLLGPNGAGKSTLFSLMSGARRPRSGDIQVAGHSAARDLGHIRSLVSLAPQDLAFYPALTGRENLEFFAGAYGVPAEEWTSRFSEAVDICALSEVLDKPSQTYSGGTKRRLNLAIALINRPAILFLDEPTVGIDARSRRTIVDAVARMRTRGVTVVYTSHYMEEVEALCDAVAIVDHGRIVSSGPVSDYRAAGGPMRITLASTPDAAQLARLTSSGMAHSGEREISAPTGPDQSPATRLAAIEAAGLAVARISFGEGRLEDAYIRIIGEAPVRGDIEA
jgi:ABC-2 type transport system ATP-binding protein